MLIIKIDHNAPRPVIDTVRDIVSREFGACHEANGKDEILLIVSASNPGADITRYSQMDGVTEVISDSRGYYLACRSFHPENTVVDVGGVQFGGDTIPVIAGPCSVESRPQIIEAAQAVKEAGAVMLRGGAFKPRTSPYSFQGLGEEALEFLAEARSRTGLPVVTEVIRPEDIGPVSRVADALQIGSRNAQNIPLLQALGRCGIPVILKRGMMMTIEEWLMAAEYILLNGNPDVILCERGIRAFEPMTRNTLDIASIPLIKQISHLPVIADPSHASGRRDIVPALCRAAIAAGADGLMIETHPLPDEALSDGEQAITPDTLKNLIPGLMKIAEASGRTL